MSGYLLSICIPTYNRSEYLKKSLDSIIFQNEFIDGKVEVIISDNASTDNTEDVASKYVERYRNIKYFKNEVNIRDRNFPLALSRGTGILRKLCNDTLIFKECSLHQICEIVEEYADNCPVLFFQNKVNDKISNQRLSFSEFVRDASYNVTWIASFSIWANECMGLDNDIAGWELLLWQVRKIYELASTKNDVVIINKSLFNVQIVKNKNISYGLYKVFYDNYMTLLKPYFDIGLLTIEDKEYLEKDLLYHFFTDWIIQWEFKNKNLHYSKEENLKKSVFDQYREKPYWNNYLMYYHTKKLKMIVQLIVKRMGRIK